MFKNRHYTKELLDNNDIPPLDLYQNLKELDFINTWLGGYAISLNVLKRVLPRNRKTVLVDIGCGGGDTLKYIAHWNKKQGFDLDLIGVDLKRDCTVYAETNKPNQSIKFITDDYRNVHLHLEKIDILHACLFCHHLTEEQILDLIQYAQKQKITLIVNDLERNSIAYYAIKFLTQLFSKSYLVKNDAPLSVLRGFKKKEWLELLGQSGVSRFEVRWRWAFRHQIVVYPL
ncbi:MAG: methyltransferase domain-containing protein [Saprospiraceae bacterium]|nr:methyltransferase domain-containing protein [Saprospiraceae bacterium]